MSTPKKRSPRAMAIVCGLAMTVTAACGSDSSSSTSSRDMIDGGFAGSAGAFTGAGGAAGSAGGAGIGGGAGTGTGGAGVGGSAGAGGMTTAMPDGGTMMGDGGVEACLAMALELDPASFPVCDQCQNARCVPNGAVPPETLDLLSDCDAENKCVPDDFVATGGTFLLETCESLDGAEGRCVPECLPDVQAQADFLPQDICEDGDLCAPCFDPTTGEATGACGVSCDPGPTDEPVLFEKCCGDRGSCVPVSAVPEDLQDSLGADTCTDTSRLCAPDAFADSTVMPPTCRSVNDSEGRCLPDCVPQVAEQADRLPQDSCEAGELCAPCFDPITAEATGACEINGDMPAEDATTFEACCSDLGSCVPTDLVPTDQQSLLDANTCSETDVLCAPNDLADPSFIPPTCDSINGFEGRCLPDCLPDVAEQADRLPQDTCAEHHLCAPCVDPITGEDTGACTLNGDMPGDGAGSFDKCCDGAGSCVPPELVPQDQQSFLGQDTCADDTALCAPDNLADTTFIPATCRSLNDSEGRCLPDCLPDVASQADRLPQDTCADGELCAPCFDPTDGADTGACTLNGDMPAEPANLFEACCHDLGSCVPTDLVSTDQQSLLDANTCSQTDVLCAPNDLADPSFIPPTCDSINGFEGRCLPDCLPDVAAEADRLPQDTCAEHHLCTPCFDPITGEDTGACTLNGDMPGDGAGSFEKCCNDLGSCVPPDLVPTDQQSLLSQDTCTDSGALCAPDDLADPTFIPTTCSSIGGFEGRCLPDCLPDVADQADRLPQDICDPNHLCAPCYDPITGEDTGACTLNGDEPAEPPGTFDKCCGGVGSCVPSSAVPDDQQSFLGQDTCTDGDALCAPDNLADSSFTPPVCDSINGFEGRCLPACLPDIQDQADQLPQDSCASHELCAPCYDPITGEDTGACTINGDAPLEEPSTFEPCCSDIGVCVPTELVSTDQQSQLGTDTCTEEGVLCAPISLASNPDAPPPECRTLGNREVEGRCLAACLPDIQDQADRLQQESCGTNELCAPCYDPTTGENTGACEINGDAPVDEPYTFPVCQATTLLIVPLGEGRCVPSYLVDPSQADLLDPKPECIEGEECAPCNDPTTGEPTGACPPE